MKETALIAMSGGVDSSVAAWLTQQQGYRCIGGIMRLLGDVSPDAAAVAHRLGMDFHVFDFSAQFEDRVIGKFIRCYEQGLTPNPCIDCNCCLKFQALLEAALDLGCSYLVTGHYARIRKDPQTGRFLLYKAAHKEKDQSYFLSGLDQFQLSHTLFPLGELTKDQVRHIAQEQGFLNARKKDSQDICFIPDGDYLSFIQRHTGKTYAPGDFLDGTGKVVGRHRGAVGYTLGQRKGLGLAMGAPVYVCGKDMQANTVTVGPNEALFHRALRADNWNFYPFPALAEPMRVLAKARSRMNEQPAWVYPEEDGFARVEFDQPQRAITPGQAVVLYSGDLVIGSGTITQVL